MLCRTKQCEMRYAERGDAEWEDGGDWVSLMHRIQRTPLSSSRAEHVLQIIRPQPSQSSYSPSSKSGSSFSLDVSLEVSTCSSSIFTGLVRIHVLWQTEQHDPPQSWHAARRFIVVPIRWQIWQLVEGDLGGEGALIVFRGDLARTLISFVAASFFFNRRMMRVVGGEFIKRAFLIVISSIFVLLRFIAGTVFVVVIVTLLVQPWGWVISGEWQTIVKTLGDLEHRAHQRAWGGVAKAGQGSIRSWRGFRV